MGARANFVIIQNGIATAYHDHWGALGCLKMFAEGADKALQALDSMDQTNKLMESVWAEGGYLVDFDNLKAITFGYLEPPDSYPPNLDSPDEETEQFYTMDIGELYSAYERGPLDFLQHIAPRWKGWLLRWDNQGVDAFSDYLRQRNITAIICQPKSHRGDPTIVEYQA